MAQGSSNAGSASTFAVAAPRPQAAADAQNVAVADAGGATGTSGNAWGVQLGAFRSKGDAERHLLTMALRDLPELNGGLRRIEAAKVQGVTFYRAQFVGLDQTSAERACLGLARERSDCLTLAPGI
ncbi:MAG: SPOR domain-containing protein [Rhodobacteraceae bacterium]|nr:SPOR domain-containing protein [Paracoccaceae bacterium]